MPTLTDVWNEIDATDPDWLDSIPKGEPTMVAAESTTQFVADGTQRALIQKMGTAYGCHTCNRSISDTKQLFIVDHIPPRGLFQRDLQATKAIYTFYAHCDLCASLQADLVRNLTHGGNSKAFLAMHRWRGLGGRKRLEECREKLAKAGLQPFEIKLLTGGNGFNFPGHGGVPRSSDRSYLNQHAFQCHSCGSKQANHRYHADHCPPKEFAMSGWFGNFLRSAADPEGWRAQIQEALTHSFFRPQCPYCSHRQGGRVNKIVITATKEVVSTGMTTTTRSGRRVRVQKYGR